MIKCHIKLYIRVFKIVLLTWFFLFDFYSLQTSKKKKQQGPRGRLNNKKNKNKAARSKSRSRSPGGSRSKSPPKTRKSKKTGKKQKSNRVVGPYLHYSKACYYTYLFLKLQKSVIQVNKQDQLLIEPSILNSLISMQQISQISG